MPTGLMGVSYSQTLAASGGTAPFTWTRVSGTLPTGLALSTGGAITGEPSELGLFNFTVNVVDSSSPTRSTTGSLQIRIKQFLAITTTSVPGAAVGSAYSVQLQATGDPPLTWSRASGNLPTGINFSAAGLLSGTPTATGTFDFVVRVTNESPTQEFTRNFQIIVGPAVSVTTSTVPQATRFVPYSATLTAAGGLPPFSWSVASGNLPTGLSLSAAGVLGEHPPCLERSILRHGPSTRAAAQRLEHFRSPWYQVRCKSQRRVCPVAYRDSPTDNNSKPQADQHPTPGPLPVELYLQDLL